MPEHPDTTGRILFLRPRGRATPAPVPASTPKPPTLVNPFRRVALDETLRRPLRALTEDDLLEYCRSLDWWLERVGHRAMRMLVTEDFDSALEELERRGLPTDAWHVHP